MPTEQQVATVVLGLINAALPAVAPPGGYAVRAYDASSVPGTKPAEFVTISIARRSGGESRSGRYVTTGWSIYVQAASQTKVANAHNSLRMAGVAIESKVLTVAGLTSTPVKFDNERPVGSDDGWFSGVHSYTFTL